MNGSERRSTERSRASDCVRQLSVLLIAVGVTAAACGGGGHSKAAPTNTPTTAPTPLPTQVAGPGLLSEVLDAEIASDPAGEVSVTFTVTDASGIPLTATTSSAQSDQQARVRFALAHLEEYAGGPGDLGNTFFRYVNETNATRPELDSGGTLEVVDATTG